MGLGSLQAQPAIDGYPRCGATFAEAEPLEEIKQVVPTRSIFRIPVVVHVVYREETGNISFEQIQSQIDVLNQDFRALNDLSVVPGPFEDRIADLQMEFCLAVRAPDGSITSGVTRRETAIDNIGLKTELYYSEMGGRNAWDPDAYLNIWIADMGENQTGRSSFPGQGLREEDGVVIDPRYFGTIGLAEDQAPYNLGRTATHEIGHYFNLLHPWGPDPVSCQRDDGVTDTPETGQTFLMECPDSILSSCGSEDMHANFMYYTNDACMGQFTPGQRNRVWATLFGARKGLLASKGCIMPGIEPAESGITFTLHPNPSDGLFYIKPNAYPGSLLKIEVFDTAGRKIWEQSSSYEESIQIELPEKGMRGLFFVRLSANGFSSTEKLVVE
ncbi:MAG: T9SS type A sorting domain-containing protein [Bacteroidetes bacterium]|nr:T9SS type A sorting domain-containing protein [Bacteroidota bacterium]